MPKFHDPRIEQVAPDALRPHPRNARTHSKKQIRQIAASIERFGFTCPLLVSDDLEIVAGHGRALAAQQLGLASVPVIRLSHLNADERRVRTTPKAVEDWFAHISTLVSTVRQVGTKPITKSHSSIKILHHIA